MNFDTVNVGDLDLAVAQAGAGGRPLLLLHGFTGAKEDFTDWLDSLASLGWHAVAPDQRGHGASDKPDDESAYSFDLFADDALALVGTLGWDHFALLGHSMGGMVAQMVALRAQDRIDALVLMDTHHRGVKIDPAVVDMAAAVVRTGGMPALADAMDALAAEQTGVEPLGTPADERLKAERPGYADFGRRKLLTSSPAMYASMSLAIVWRDGGPDRLGELPALKVPTLILVGDQDKPFLAASERMAEAIDGAELVVIPDAGHSPQFEAPEPWWDALTRFLDELATSKQG